MLRTALVRLTPSLWSSAYNVSGNAVGVQSARWARKPRKPFHLGTAKSKMFRVPPRIKEDPEERAELQRLHKTYKTQMRSLMAFFAEEEAKRVSSVSGRFQISPEEEQAELADCHRLNNEWNERVADQRKERLALERSQRHEAILKDMEQKDLEREEQLEFAENRVRFEKEQAATFITPETIDAVIEEALASPSDFNFAIDMKRDIHYGRRTPTSPKELPDGDDGQKQRRLGSSI